MTDFFQKVTDRRPIVISIPAKSNNFTNVIYNICLRIPFYGKHLTFISKVAIRAWSYTEKYILEKMKMNVSTESKCSYPTTHTEWESLRI